MEIKPRTSCAAHSHSQVRGEKVSAVCVGVSAPATALCGSPALSHSHAPMQKQLNFISLNQVLCLSLELELFPSATRSIFITEIFSPFEHHFSLQTFA